MTRPIVVFDGECALCNGFVAWLIRHDKRGEFLGCGDRRDPSCIDDGPGDTRRLGLLAVAPEQRCQLGGVERGEQLRGRHAAARVEAHVQRTPGPETKPALAVGELEARQAEIEEGAIHGAEAGSRGDVGQLAKVGLAEDEAVPVEGAKSGPDTGDRSGVCIETQEAAIRIGRLQDPLGVPTAAQGGVDVKAAGSRREHPDDLVRQHRQVPFLHLSSIPERIGSRADPGSAYGRELDPQALEGRSKLPWVVERLAVGIPPVRCPDLRVIA